MSELRGSAAMCRSKQIFQSPLTLLTLFAISKLLQKVSDGACLHLARKLHHVVLNSSTKCKKGGVAAARHRDVALHAQLSTENVSQKFWLTSPASGRWWQQSACCPVPSDIPMHDRALTLHKDAAGPTKQASCAEAALLGPLVGL